MASRKRGHVKAIIQKYLREHPDGTHQGFLEWAEGDVTVSSRYFVAVRGLCRPSLRADPDKETPRAEALQTALDHVRAENEYLRWLLMGERNGWLNRALDELSNNPPTGPA